MVVVCSQIQIEKHGISRDSIRKGLCLSAELFSFALNLTAGEQAESKAEAASAGGADAKAECKSHFLVTTSEKRAWVSAALTWSVFLAASAGVAHVASQWCHSTFLSLPCLCPSPPPQFNVCMPMHVLLWPGVCAAVTCSREVSLPGRHACDQVVCDWCCR